MLTHVYKRAAAFARRVKAALGRRRRKVFAGLFLTMFAALAVAAVLRSPETIVVALAVMAVVVAAASLEAWASRRALRQAQSESTTLQRKLAGLESAQALLAVMLYEQTYASGNAQPELLPDKLVGTTVRGLLAEGSAVDAYAVATSKDRIRQLPLPTLRKLRNDLRRRGYLVKAAQVAAVAVRVGGNAGDKRERTMIEGEIAVLSGAFVPSVRPEERVFEPRAGRVL
ncbi:hypothetical protein AB0H43_38605, partial [Hamadaea sp. NPDC050747]|uniref:hypothetical protein n=1 Tax=Hamadaea sp. NPDC050747 TaxID=3155789 RepID=UPI0033DB3CAB